MSKKKTPIVVTLKRGKHKTQPWMFYIDDAGPGPKVTVKERYAKPRNAWRGALRKLGAWKGTTAGDHKTPDGHPIVRVLA